MGGFHGMEPFLGLAFDDDQLLDQQVGSETAIEFHFVVDERDRPLFFDAKSKLFELMCQTGAVRRFEESRTESAMNLDGCADDRRGEFIDVHGWLTPRKAEI